MERPDIMAGINQAVEKGESLEKAKQTFLDAGYSSQDVEDSVRAINSGVIPHFVNNTSNQQISPSAQPALQSSPSQSQQQVQIQTPSFQPAQESSGGRIFLIVLLIIILLIALGGLAVVLFAKDQAVSFLESIGIM